MKNFYKIFNSGTSDGAKKGWARRGLAMRAKLASNPKFGDYQKVKKGADVLSDKAKKSGNPDDHDLAYHSHLGAHEIAESKSDRPAMRYHESMMAYHEKSSKRAEDRLERQAVSVGLRAAKKLHRDLGN